MPLLQYELRNPSKIHTAGLIKENPVFVLLLGTCPTLAVTSSVIGAFSMGLAAAAVLICSNMAISALRKVIPDTEYAVLDIRPHWLTQSGGYLETYLEAGYTVVYEEPNLILILKAP